MRFTTKLFAAGALLLASCNPAAVTYYKIGATTPSALTGTDCPGATGGVTLAGIDNAGTVAIYAQPNNQFFLDLGSVPAIEGAAGADVGMTGTLSGGAYKFTGSYLRDQEGMPEIKTSVVITVNLTPNGSGATGTLTTEYVCNASDNISCGLLNPIATMVASSDGKDFDCTTTSGLVGAQITNSQEAAAVTEATP